MGFILTDLGNQDNQLFVNFWNWRPTVELIRSFGILDEERIELLHMQTIGDTITISEAHQIGKRIEAEILPQIPEDGRMLLDLRVSIEPDDSVILRRRYRQELQCNHWMVVRICYILFELCGISSILSQKEGLTTVATGCERWADWPNTAVVGRGILPR